MKTRLHTAAPEHEVVYQELVALVRKHADHLSSVEMLAIAANMLGKLVAMQDERTMTSEMAMEIVAQNIEEGNRQAIEQLMSSKGES